MNLFDQAWSGFQQKPSTDIKLLLMVYAILPESLSGFKSGNSLFEHPFFEIVSKGDYKDVAMVALLDDCNGNIYIADRLRQGRTPLQNQTGISIPVVKLNAPDKRGVDADVLSQFMEYAVQYAKRSTDATATPESRVKTLFWWMGHGNGYRPIISQGAYGTWVQVPTDVPAPLLYERVAEPAVDVDAEPATTAAAPRNATDPIREGDEPGPRNDSWNTIPTEYVARAFEVARNELGRPLSGVYLSNCMNFSYHVLSAIGDNARIIAGYPNYNWFLRAEWTANDDDPSTWLAPRYDAVITQARKFGAFDWSEEEFARSVLGRLMDDNMMRMERFTTKNNAKMQELQLSPGEVLYPLLACMANGYEVAQLKYWVDRLAIGLKDALRYDPDKKHKELIDKAFKTAQRYDTPNPYRDNALNQHDAIVDLRDFVAKLNSLGSRREFDGEDDLQTVKDASDAISAIGSITRMWYFDGRRGMVPDGKDYWEFSESHNRASGKRSQLGVGIFCPHPVPIDELDAGILEVPDISGLSRETFGKAVKKIKQDYAGRVFWDPRALPFFFPDRGLSTDPWAQFVREYNDQVKKQKLDSWQDITLVVPTTNPTGAFRNVSKPTT